MLYGEIFLNGEKCSNYGSTNIWKSFTSSKRPHSAFCIDVDRIFQEVSLHFCNMFSSKLLPIHLSQCFKPPHAIETLRTVETFLKSSNVLCPQRHPISVDLDGVTQFSSDKLLSTDIIRNTHFENSRANSIIW